MITLDRAEVKWDLNAYCKFQCSYCPNEAKNGDLTHTIEEYLNVVQKLQNTRYQHHKTIYWELGGGEPLHFSHLITILRKIKEQPSTVCLETSGDDTYFTLYGIMNYIDKLKLTYHPWQNNDVVDFILEQAREKNIKVSITVPLVPGKIFESRQQVKQYQAEGYDCQEQLLFGPGGKLYAGYSQIDENRIFGRADDYIAPVIVLDPNLPMPGYIDLRVVTVKEHVYTGLPCYAGVDWIYINHRGFASYSQCGGRSEHFNVFDPNWQPPTNHFICNINQCRSEQDRKKIRIANS